MPGDTAVCSECGWGCVPVDETTAGPICQRCADELDRRMAEEEAEREAEDGGYDTLEEERGER